MERVGMQIFSTPSARKSWMFDGGKVHQSRLLYKEIQRRDRLVKCRGEVVKFFLPTCFQRYLKVNVFSWFCRVFCCVANKTRRKPMFSFSTRYFFELHHDINFLKGSKVWKYKLQSKLNRKLKVIDSVKSWKWRVSCWVAQKNSLARWNSAMFDNVSLQCRRITLASFVSFLHAS